MITTHHTAGLDELTDALEIHCDEPDSAAGGGVHLYKAVTTTPDVREVGHVQFQHGPRGVAGSKAGMTALAHVSILIHHMQSFQAGPFACRENALVITALEEAKGWMLKRVIDRKLRNVLGKNEK